MRTNLPSQRLVRYRFHHIILFNEAVSPGLEEDHNDGIILTTRCTIDVEEVRFLDVHHTEIPFDALNGDNIHLSFFEPRPCIFPFDPCILVVSVLFLLP